MNRFGGYTPHGNTCIGETLDQLLNGNSSVQSIPNISVAQRNGKWFTSDNRRLWVFRKAEEIGFLKTIYVNKTYYIRDDKFTTENGGTSIRVRGGGPGGSRWRTWKPKRPPTTTTHVSYNSNIVYSPNRNTRSSYQYSDHNSNGNTDTETDSDIDNTSSNNGSNEDDTRNAVHTTSRWRTAEHLFENTDVRNNTFISPGRFTFTRSLKGSSNSKCVYEAMDKTRSYAWENPRQVMEDEISGSCSPVTGSRSHDLNFDFGFRGDHGGEIHKIRSPLYIRDKHDSHDLIKSSIRDQDPPVSTNSRHKGIRMSKDKLSGNNGRNEDDRRNAVHTISRWNTMENLFEDTDNRNNTLISPGTDSHLHGGF